MIPKIVHITSKSKDLKFEEKLILKKNKKLLKNWQFIIYDDQDNQELIDLEFPNFSESYKKIKKGVVKADIIRCIYMYKFGGIYIDTDYQFIKSIPDDLLNKECIIPPESWINNIPYLGNCIFLSSPRYKFWLDYISYLFKDFDLHNTQEDQVISKTGPGGLTSFYLNNIEQYPELYLPPKSVFHPLIKSLGLKIVISPDTLGIHYCFGSWRSSSFLKRIFFKFIQKIQALGLIEKLNRTM
jgi:mannosyltransferase OCH1-like enzyme